MVFGGIQKLTLLDFPGTVACILFTKGCNFRCPFCHNTSLVMAEDNSSDYPREEILSFLKKRQGILEGVCITGGEPLLHPSLGNFLKEVKSLGYKVKLDTNGSMPDRFKELVEASLVDYVAMDIKNSFEKYPLTSGCESVSIQDIEESIDYLLTSPVPYEFRTTVVRELHTVGDIEAIAKRIASAPRYFLQNFVDSGDILSANLHPVSEEEILKMSQAAAFWVPSVKIR